MPKSSVKTDGMDLQHASEDQQNNIDVVLTAVQGRGSALQFASQELQSNFYVVMAAIQQCGDALEFASRDLRTNFDVVVAAVQSNGYALEYASEELQSDNNIVMSAVQSIGYALKYASEELRNNYNIVMASARKSGGALQYASEELQSNFDVVLAAVQFPGGAAALLRASATLVENVELVSQGIRSTNSYQLSNSPLHSDGLLARLREVTIELIKSEQEWNTKFHFQDDTAQIGAVQLHRRNMLVPLSMNRYGRGECANFMMKFLSTGISFAKEATRLSPILAALTERGFDLATLGSRCSLGRDDAGCQVDRSEIERL